MVIKKQYIYKYFLSHTIRHLRFDSGAVAAALYIQQTERRIGSEVLAAATSHSISPLMDKNIDTLTRIPLLSASKHFSKFINLTF